jgi:predicted alpha/beta-fold hydrolase
LFAAVMPVIAQNPAITTDPAVDKANPAAMQTFEIPSHGALLNAFAYVAAGAGPHPTVILLHGFTGNEPNLDLAQSIRRAGWNVIYFDYRGSWGLARRLLFHS